MPLFRPATKRAFASRSKWPASRRRRRKTSDAERRTGQRLMKATTEINPQLVKQLREKTNAGMMDCKRAPVESGGDLEKEEAIVRTKGVAAAGRMSSRATNEGIVECNIRLMVTY